MLPLLSYAFVYIRGAQHPEWRGAGQWPSTWSWFVDFISTRQGRGELTWSLKPLWTSQYPSLVGHELTWIVLTGGLIGLLLMAGGAGFFGQHALALRRVQLRRPAGQLVPGGDAGLCPAGGHLWRRVGRLWQALE